MVGYFSGTASDYRIQAVNSTVTFNVESSNTGAKLTDKYTRNIYSKPLIENFVAPKVKKMVQTDGLGRIVEAIKETINGYKGIGADPKTKTLHINCNMQEAMELSITFKGQIKLLFKVDGEELYIYDEEGTSYIAFNTRIDNEVRNGASFNSAVSMHTKRLRDIGDVGTAIRNAEARTKIYKNPYGSKSCKFELDYSAV